MFFLDPISYPENFSDLAAFIAVFFCFLRAILNLTEGWFWISKHLSEGIQCSSHSICLSLHVFS